MIMKLSGASEVNPGTTFLSEAYSRRLNCKSAQFREARSRHFFNFLTCEGHLAFECEMFGKQFP
jgi:hypothetical protein